MTRPYSLFKKSNGYYYVQFLLDGSRSQNKSTGTKDRKEAESIAMRWAVIGDIPERINSKAEKGKFQSVDRISFFNSMSTYDFSPEEIHKMISIMQKRGFILSAVKPNSKQSIPIEEYLDEFWNYEKSPYVQELALEGKILSRSHVKNERSRVENYWIPKLKGKCIGSITNDMLKDIVSDKTIQKLAGKTNNGIVESITTPLKWAMKNQYIENITFYGLKRRNTKSEERAILTMEEADNVMNIGWENDKAKLANKLAMQTGMRASEIRGLRICDIHAEGIIVDHAWDRYARANKCCKNGEARRTYRDDQINEIVKQFTAAFANSNKAIKDGYDAQIREYDKALNGYTKQTMGGTRRIFGAQGIKEMFESATPELLRKIAGVIAEHGCKDVKEWMQKSPWYREFELGREAERKLRREREWER